MRDHRALRGWYPALIAVCAGVLLTQPVAAQMCFRGGKQPACRFFWITESGYARRLNTNNGANSDYLSADVGLMANVTTQDAVGLTVFLGFLAEWGFDGRVGAKLRYRRWLGDGLSLDVSPGLLLYRPEGRDGFQLGFTGHLGLNISDRLVLFNQLEIFDQQRVIVGRFPGLGGRYPSPSNVAWYIGARLGSKPAVITTTTIGALAALSALLLSGGFGLNLGS